MQAWAGTAPAGLLGYNSLLIMTGGLSHDDSEGISRLRRSKLAEDRPYEGLDRARDGCNEDSQRSVCSEEAHDPNHSQDLGKETSSQGSLRAIMRLMPMNS